MNGESIVLNAFRHHRGRHGEEIGGGTMTFGAQRLSASQRSARATASDLLRR